MNFPPASTRLVSVLVRPKTLVDLTPFEGNEDETLRDMILSGDGENGPRTRLTPLEKREESAASHRFLEAAFDEPAFTHPSRSFEPARMPFMIWTANDGSDMT